MTKQDLAERMSAAQAWVPGKRIKLDFAEQGAIMLDGEAGRVSEEDGVADTTIRIGWDDWQQLRSGELDPMTAFITGKLRVDGDTGGAMQLAGVLSKLRS